MPQFRNREEYEKWKSEQLKASKESAGASQDTPPPPDKRPSSSGPRDGSGALRPLGELFSRAFEIYRQRFGALFGIILLSVLLLFAAAIVLALIGAGLALAIPGKKQVVIAITALIGSIPFFAVMFWGMAAFVFAVADNTLGIKESFGRGWRSVWSFMWLYTILGFVVTGGFLLFLLPGIIFSVWFAFAQFILARDDVRGMDAMLKSKEYVRGKWPEVFGRLAAVWFVSLLLGVIPFLGPILSLLFAPFVMIFICLIYEDLVGIKGSSPSYATTGGAKCRWVGVGALGYVVAPLVVIAVFGTAIMLPLLILKGTLASGGGRTTFPSPGGTITVPAPSPPVMPSAPEGTGTGTVPSPAETKTEATGEAFIVKDGVQETYLLQTGFFSETRMANPSRATIQFQIPAEPHSNARRIEMTLDAAKTGEYVIDGRAMNDRMFNSTPDQAPLDATFRFVADGGQIFPPKETCRLIVTSPYTGTADSVFAGEVENCVVHSAGIDYTISAKFAMRGASSR